MYITLGSYQKSHPHGGAYDKIKKELGPDAQADTQIPLTHLLEVGGVDEVLWVLDVAMARPDYCFAFLMDCARVARALVSTLINRTAPKSWVYPEVNIALAEARALLEARRTAIHPAAVSGLAWTAHGAALDCAHSTATASVWAGCLLEGEPVREACEATSLQAFAEAVWADQSLRGDEALDATYEAMCGFREIARQAVAAATYMDGAATALRDDASAAGESLRDAVARSLHIRLAQYC